MEYVVIMLVCILLFLLITIFKFKSVLKPNMIFSGLWFVGAFFINLNIGGIKDISTNTNIYMILTVVAFNIGYLVVTSSRTVLFQLNELKKSLNIDLKWRTLLFFNMLMVVMCFPYFCKMLRILFSHSFYQVRVEIYNYSNAYELLMSKVIFLPMYALFNLILMICVMKIFLGEKDYKLYGLMLFDAAYYTLLTGSRNFIAKFFVYMVVAYVLGNALLRKKRTISLKLIFVAVIIAIILNYAIKARSLGTLSPVENIIVYLFGGISYFDHIIQSDVFEVENAIKLYGTGTLAWIISPILYILSLLSILPDYTAESIIGRVTSQGIYISNNFNFNALTTAMYPMWRDFRGIGIAIGMLLFGIIVARREKKFLYEPSIKNFLMFFTFVIAVAESTQLYDMLYIRFSVQIFWIYFLFGDKKFIWNKRKMLM